MGLLERSVELDALTQALTSMASGGQGRVALVSGEAGIGKTALLRQFSARVAATARVLWARCEPLFTPRPLGPVLELASVIGPQVAARAAEGGTAFDLATALVSALTVEPAVVIFEDLHWADEATLDVVRLFARRVADVKVLLVLSYRDDELHRSHPLRMVLGNLPGRGQVTRLELAGLSPQAVAELVGSAQMDAGELHRRTAGNPFFVTEVLPAGTETVPHSVRDAVLARAAPLTGPARDLLEAISVVPGPIEGWLLDALVPGGGDALDECIGTGMVVLAGDRVEFRHEIARQVVEESMPPGRRKAMHRTALAALSLRPAGQQDPARLTHHADAAGDAVAVLAYAPVAAARAAAAGACREAARLYAQALRFADMVEADRQATLLEGFADAAYFTQLNREATEALRKAVVIHQARGDHVRRGAALRRLGNQLGKDGALAESEAAISEAVALLERHPPTRELALAYNSMAAVKGIYDDEAAVLWGKRAMAVAEQLGCLDAVGETLTIVGTAELRQGNLGGLDKLHRSREIARQVGDEAGMQRSYVRPAAALAGRREWVLAESYIREGRDYCRERGMLPLYGWLTNRAAESALAQGRWGEAVSIAAEILAWPANEAGQLRVIALVVTATVSARRGEPGYRQLLDQAAALAQGLPPTVRPAVNIAALRAEAAWLAGAEPSRIAEAVRLPGTAGPEVIRWFAGEVEAWRHRAGLDCGDLAGLPEPHRLEISGDVEGAARWWQERGCSYDAALALACSGDPNLMRRALGLLRDLGAQPATAVVARRLRLLGARGLPRGPRPATAANPASLTTREVEVLRLLAAGLANREIAARLVLSDRTVDHHVSVILRKLGVPNRAEARAAALRLGLVSAVE